MSADAGSASAVSTRYGPFNLFDHRSIYGNFWFVEPLRAPEMDVDREFRVDYLHGEKPGFRTDQARVEVEYNSNMLTVELGSGWQRDSAAFNSTAERAVRHQSQGITNIELAARHPLLQYVSANDFFDYTLVAAFELGVPSNAPVSKDSEFVPQFFQLLRVGDHLSVEASAGYSLLAGAREGGTNTFEYSLVLGYNLEHDDLPIPHVLRTIPILEFNGEGIVHGGERGADRLFGTAGFRINLEPVGAAQPRLGIGYLLPLDQAARSEMRWGIVTSLVFEF